MNLIYSMFYFISNNCSKYCFHNGIRNKIFFINLFSFQNEIDFHKYLFFTFWHKCLYSMYIINHTFQLHNVHKLDSVL